MEKDSEDSAAPAQGSPTDMPPPPAPPSVLLLQAQGLWDTGPRAEGTRLGSPWTQGFMGTHTPGLQPRWATATLCSPFPHDPSCFGEISLCPLPSSEPDFVLNCHGVTPMVIRGRKQVLGRTAHVSSTTGGGPMMSTEPKSQGTDTVLSGSKVRLCPWAPRCLGPWEPAPGTVTG